MPRRWWSCAAPWRRTGALPTACRADPGEVAALVAHDPPAAVVAVGADAAALRHRLDPLGPRPRPRGGRAGGADRAGRAVRRRPPRGACARSSTGASCAPAPSELEAVAADLAIARAARRRRGGARHAAAAGDGGRVPRRQHARAHRARRRPGRPAGPPAAATTTAPSGSCARRRRCTTSARSPIPDTVLLKPGSLTSEEFEVVKTHAVLGARVLAGSDSDLLVAAERVARSHHERWDGSGYPDGLAGDGDPARGPARARRRRVRRARARAPVQGVVDRRGGGGGDPRAARARSSTPRSWTRSRRSAPPPGQPARRLKSTRDPAPPGARPRGCAAVGRGGGKGRPRRITT